MKEKHAVLNKIALIEQANNLNGIVELLKNNKADYGISEHAILALRLRQLKAADQYQIMYPPLAYVPTTMLYKPGSDFAAYQEPFLKLSEQFYNNGRFKHNRERNMRQYINQLHSH